MVLYLLFCTINDKNDLISVGTELSLLELKTHTLTIKPTLENVEDPDGSCDCKASLNMVDKLI